MDNKLEIGILEISLLIWFPIMLFLIYYNMNIFYNYDVYIKDQANGTYFEYISFIKINNGGLMNNLDNNNNGYNDYKYGKYRQLSWDYKISDIKCLHKLKNKTIEEYEYIEQCADFKNEEILLQKNNTNKNISFDLWKKDIISFYIKKYYDILKFLLPSTH